MSLDSDCNWQQHNCEYDSLFTGDFVPVRGQPKWFTGRQTIEGTIAYVSTPAEPEWWKHAPPQGTGGRPGPFLTFSFARAQAFNRVVLAYPIAWSKLDVLFTSNQGGFETQEEVFQAGYLAYYSCKECELSIQNAHVGDYLDWEAVEVVWRPA